MHVPDLNAMVVTELKPGELLFDGFTDSCTGATFGHTHSTGKPACCALGWLGVRLGFYKQGELNAAEATLWPAIASHPLVLPIVDELREYRASRGFKSTLNNDGVIISFHDNTETLHEYEAPPTPAIWRSVERNARRKFRLAYTERDTI